jgi:hypothetical protein
MVAISRAVCAGCRTSLFAMLVASRMADVTDAAAISPIIGSGRST